MIPRWAKIGLILFALYMLFTAPAQSAMAVRSAGGILQSGASSLQTFVTTVFG